MVRLLKSSLDFENEVLIVYDNLNDNSVPEAKKLEKISLVFGQFIIQ